MEIGTDTILLKNSVLKNIEKKEWNLCSVVPASHVLNLFRREFI